MADQMIGTCQCPPDVRVGSHLNSVVVPIPSHMESYSVARVTAGLSSTVGIDRCILEEIQDLWAKGIRTYGSCCGHNHSPSMVNVHADDDVAMLSMGYVRWPDLLERQLYPHTFYLKSTQRLNDEV